MLALSYMFCTGTSFPNCSIYLPMYLEDILLFMAWVEMRTEKLSVRGIQMVFVVKVDMNNNKGC
jgi:hypothetical protein